MHPIAAFAVQETDSALTHLRAEIQASLALNRAVLQALATLSPTMAAAAERALDDELRLARHGEAPSLVLELIEDARERRMSGPAAASRPATARRAQPCSSRPTCKPGRRAG